MQYFTAPFPQKRMVPLTGGLDESRAGDDRIVVFRHPMDPHKTHHAADKVSSRYQKPAI